MSNLLLQRFRLCQTSANRLRHCLRFMGTDTSPTTARRRVHFKRLSPKLAGGGKLEKYAKEHTGERTDNLLKAGMREVPKADRKKNEGRQNVPGFIVAASRYLNLTPPAPSSNYDQPSFSTHSSSVVGIVRAFADGKENPPPENAFVFLDALADSLADEDSAADLLDVQNKDEMLEFLISVDKLFSNSSGDSKALTKLCSFLDNRATALRLFTPRPSLPLTTLLLECHAKASTRPENLLWNIANNAGYITGNADQGQIVRILEAFARHNYHAPSFFRAVLDSVCGNRQYSWIEKAEPAEVANLIKCYSKLGLWSPRLNKAVDNRCKEIVLETGTPRDVATIAFAFSRLGKIPKIFRALQRDKTLRFRTNARVGDTIAVMWSLTTCGLAKEKQDLLVGLWESTIAAIEEGQISHFEANLLAQIALAAHLDDVELVSPGAERWLEKIQLESRANAARRADGSTKSAYEDVCSAMLSEIGFRHHTNVNGFKSVTTSKWFAPAFDKMMLVDMADEEKRVAVEYDGQFHYLTNIEDRSSKQYAGSANGTTASKRRLLEKAGWTVVSVEWTKLAAFYDLLRTGEMNGDNNTIEKGRTLYKQYLKTLMKDHL